METISKHCCKLFKNEVGDSKQSDIITLPDEKTLPAELAYGPSITESVHNQNLSDTDIHSGKSSTSLDRIISTKNTAVTLHHADLNLHHCKMDYKKLSHAKVKRTKSIHNRESYHLNKAKSKLQEQTPNIQNFTKTTTVDSLESDTNQSSAQQILRKSCTKSPNACQNNNDKRMSYHSMQTTSTYIDAESLKNGDSIARCVKGLTHSLSFSKEETSQESGIESGSEETSQKNAKKSPLFKFSLRGKLSHENKENLNETQDSTVPLTQMRANSSGWLSGFSFFPSKSLNQKPEPNTIKFEQKSNFNTLLTKSCDSTPLDYNFKYSTTVSPKTDPQKALHISKTLRTISQLSETNPEFNLQLKKELERTFSDHKCVTNNLSAQPGSRKMMKTPDNLQRSNSGFTHFSSIFKKDDTLGRIIVDEMLKQEHIEPATLETILHEISEDIRDELNKFTGDKKVENLCVQRTSFLIKFSHLLTPS